MKRTTVVIATMAILLGGLTLRTLWLRADPPLVGAPNGVGVVWHDEGAWVHSARNKALWGVWRTDEWNPVFLTPVFTALEYGAFTLTGVGTWQARTVPVASGLVAIAALMWGLARLGGMRAAMIGGVLLATNYSFVMWNRAALMESTMTAAIVCGWAAYTWADRRAWWAAVAGVAVVLAWFTKAASAFFVAALIAEAALDVVTSWRNRRTVPNSWPRRHAVAAWLCVGLAASAAVAGLLFVLPHWSEYQFYNWRMSVERKPSYTLKDLMDRASWLPFAQGLFFQMALVTVLGLKDIPRIVSRWSSETRGVRLLALWILIGFVELIVHDSGNERRYVMFIPALIGLTALSWTTPATATRKRMHQAPTDKPQSEPTGGSSNREASVPTDPHPRLSGWDQWLVVFPVWLLVGYVSLGTFLRPFFIDDIVARNYSMVVRTTAAGALALGLLMTWRRESPFLRTPPLGVAAALTAVAIAWNLPEYSRWISHRAYTNYDASVALGRVLPEGALVQGKLANGLALENHIRPLFVGNAFGNYEDRLERDDARYILTYDLPSIGYESQHRSGLIEEILNRYPGYQVVGRFAVDETPMIDRAVLIDKFPDSTPHAPD